MNIIDNLLEINDGTIKLNNETISMDQLKILYSKEDIIYHLLYVRKEAIKSIKKIQVHISSPKNDINKPLEYYFRYDIQLYSVDRQDGVLIKRIDGRNNPDLEDYIMQNESILQK